MQRVDASLPLEPQRPRLLGVEIVFDLESHAAGEVLRALADQQVVVGRVHHGPRHQRRRPHAFERGHATRALPRAMHAARIELDHSFCIRQSAVPDAVVGRIKLADVDAGDERVQHVRCAARHQRELPLLIRAANRRLTIPLWHKNDVSARDHRIFVRHNTAGRHQSRTSVAADCDRRE